MGANSQKIWVVISCKALRMTLATPQKLLLNCLNYEMYNKKKEY